MNQKLMPVQDLLKGAFEQYKKHYKVLAGIMLIAGIGLYAQTILMYFTLKSAAVPMSYQYGEYGMNYPVATGAGLAGFGALALIASLVYLVGMLWGVPAVLNYINKIDQPMSIKEAFMQAKPFIWPTFITSLIAGILTAIGFILVIIPGIIVGVWLSFALYIVIVENKKGVEALKSSKAYVEGYWWPVFGRMFLVGLGIAIIAGIVGNILQSILGYTFGMLAQNVIMLVLIPYIFLYQFALYKNLKQVKGGSAHVESTPAV